MWGTVLEMRYTPDLVKNHIWRPIQETLFDIKSTTKINTEQINEIMDVLIKFFAERGIVLEFPNKEQLEKLIKEITILSQISSLLSLFILIASSRRFITFSKKFEEFSSDIF